MKLRAMIFFITVMIGTGCSNNSGAEGIVQEAPVYRSISTSTSLPTSYALIVGVSKYQSLPESMQLTGPKYDAEMVRDFLAAQKMRSFPTENITVLADGVEGAEAPKRKTILAAMDAITSKAGKGDFIYLHFSGHGSRQPGKPGDNSEADGLDELFLPSDIGRWDNAIGTVENALIDDEIGGRVAAMRAKGAFVWAVFDSCHSGTMTRGVAVGEDVKMRKVTATALGIPQAALDRAAARAPKTRGHGGTRESALEGIPATAGEDQGGFVAFYAAQTTQQTPEMRLPAGEAGRQSHGLFSFTLLQVISENPGITYRQAGQEILQRYSAANMDRPTPLFEGTLDARVFGSKEMDRTQQWPVDVKNGEWHIPAGNLNRLAEGSVVAILASPTDSDAKALAYAEVTKPQSMDSVLKPVAYKGKKANVLKQMPDHAYARLVELKQDFGIRVAKPAQGNIEITIDDKGTIKVLEQNTKNLQRVLGILGSLHPDADTGLRAEFVRPGVNADIRLVVADGQLWFLSPTGRLERTGDMKSPSIKLKGKDATALNAAITDNLANIARVVNLLRVSKGMGAGSSTMDVYLTVKRKAGGKEEKVTGDMVPEMYPGDIVYITAQNTSAKPMDLNILFIGSDFSIKPIFSGRIHPQDALKKRGLFRVTDSSFGKERLLVIANEAKAESMVQDLRFLKQAALPKTRGRGLSGLGSLLRDAGFGATKTRGAELFGEDEAGGAAFILQFSLETKQML